MVSHMEPTPTRYTPERCTGMATQLWPHAQPLLPADVQRPQGGGVRSSTRDQLLFQTMTFVLLNNICWRGHDQNYPHLVTGPTLNRRFHTWTEHDLWPRLYTATATGADRLTAYHAALLCHAAMTRSGLVRYETALADIRAHNQLTDAA